MVISSDFCRTQEALQRDRAAGAQLENVRTIATKAAIAWALEATLAERREAKRDGLGSLPEAASSSEEMEDQLLRENPDSSFAA